MSKSPLVSVIIIFFNAEKYFQETIDSVFKQTFQDFELLLVDDGSTDKSTEIALSYAYKHSNQVRYLEHKNHQNLGMSATRNLGISFAQGKYITFLDADDVWFPNSLEEKVKIIESYPDVAMVYGGVEYWYSWTDKKQDRGKDRIKYPSSPLNTIVKAPKLFPVVVKQSFTPIGSPIYQKRLIEKIKGFEDCFKGSYEDDAFFIKVSLRCKTLAVDKCWLKYRQHPQSSCAQNKKQRKAYENRTFFLLWLKQYLVQEKVYDWRVWLAFQKENLRCLNLTIYDISNQPTYRWRIWYILKLIIKPFLVASLFQKFVEAIESSR